MWIPPDLPPNSTIRLVPFEKSTTNSQGLSVGDQPNPTAAGRVVQGVPVVAEQRLDEACPLPADLRDDLFVVRVDHTEFAAEKISLHHEHLPGAERDGEPVGEEPHLPGDGRQHGTVASHDLVGVPPEVPNVTDVRQEATICIQHVELAGPQEEPASAALRAAHHADDLLLVVEDVELGGEAVAELLQDQ